MGAREDADFIRQQARSSNEMFATSLPMIASENVLSPRCLEMLVTDFHGRYAEGHPGRRYYQGCAHFDEVETRTVELAKTLFGAPYANVQATSGTVANMAVLKALAKPGEKITAVSTADGGHISHAKMGAVGVRGLHVTEYPWDAERMTVDPVGAAKTIRKVEPKVALFGQSVFLFPTPLKGEVADAAREVGATVMYDAAHVLGLIAGGRFQDPLREGADVMTGSTHKTLPGPQGGVVVSGHAGADDEDAKFLRKLDTGVFPGVTSSYHLHHVAAKGVAFAEHIEFGKKYAEDTVANAKAFAGALAAQGFKVFAEEHGYTESHQCLVQVGEIGQGKGKWAAAELEKAGIITNMNMIPGDTKPMSPSGLRLGVQELTRLGMGADDMATVAGFYARVLLKGEAPDTVRKDVTAFRSGFTELQYCFNEAGAGGYEFRTFF